MGVSSRVQVLQVHRDRENGVWLGRSGTTQAQVSAHPCDRSSLATFLSTVAFLATFPPEQDERVLGTRHPIPAALSWPSLYGISTGRLRRFGNAGCCWVRRVCRDGRRMLEVGDGKEEESELMEEVGDNGRGGGDPGP